jgi:hypothetical protein
MDPNAALDGSRVGDETFRVRAVFIDFDEGPSLLWVGTAGPDCVCVFG